jgi:small subunit ribosomal protein S8
MAVVSDRVADLLTRIRNGKMAKHRYVDIPLSKLSVAIIEALKRCGYIHNYLVSEERRMVRLFLKYKKGSREPVLRGLKRISSPGCRRYVGADRIPYVASGLGSAILSTPKGVLDGETARKEHVGGEILCYVW